MGDYYDEYSDHDEYYSDESDDDNNYDEDQYNSHETRRYRLARRRGRSLKIPTWLDDFLPTNMQITMKNPLFKIVQKWFHVRSGFDVARLVWAITLLIPVKKYSNEGIDWLRKNGTNSVKIPLDDSLATNLQACVKRQPTNSLFSWMPSFKKLEWTELGWNNRRRNNADEDAKELVAAGSYSIFFYQGIPFLLRLPKSNNERELTLHCLWGSSGPIAKLLEHVRQVSEKKDKSLYIRHIYAHEYRNIYAKKRSIHTIDLEPRIKHDIVTDLQNYFDKTAERYYNDCGTPYRRGYMFYGPPGTGKTSISQAIASEWDLGLYVFYLGDMTDSQLQEKFQNLPHHCVVLFEDIDNAGIIRESTLPSINLSKLRESNASDDTDYPDGFTMPNGRAYFPADNEAQIRIPRKTKVTLSGLLNAIDGPGSKEGRLVIMTTNAPDALDKALYRRGRIDRKFVLGYSTKRSASITFMRIFGRDPLNTIPEKRLTNMSKRFGNQVPLDVFTPSDIQEFCLGYRGRPQEAINEFGSFVQDRLSGKHDFEYDITRAQHKAIMSDKRSGSIEDDMLSEEEEDEDEIDVVTQEVKQTGTNSSLTSSGQMTPSSEEFRLFNTEHELEELVSGTLPGSTKRPVKQTGWTMNPMPFLGSLFKRAPTKPDPVSVSDLILPALAMNCGVQISPYAQRALLPGANTSSNSTIDSSADSGSASPKNHSPEQQTPTEAHVSGATEATNLDQTFQNFRRPSHEDVAGQRNIYPFHGAVPDMDKVKPWEEPLRDEHTVLLRTVPPLSLDDPEVLHLKHGKEEEDLLEG
ncbi:P-loop containing nucleoside triphosphate hydrolase protein [Lophiostoma macrostomum CBS 122681]|uniref:P-loop containing nucleoside triphosphate hydrolase protein n=1 Tax=Lophiostoma macrostomum CBS 122681 TaxID=1314788 RepID=A0A6A6STR7_9PLEO|nr:P-loop containing nucleoside triphosphate hydrolase protein [Lophiostoma macrostomum CBS 122681]